MSAARLPATGVEVADRRDADRVRADHLLLVEDSTATRRILRGLLEDAGYRISEAADGAEALDRLGDDDHPDLILLDLDMPVMDGATFLIRLRASEALAELPVIVLTAEDDAAVVAAAFAAGAKDYARKTDTDDELKARITVVLRRHRQEHELRARIAHAESLTVVDALTGLGNRRALERYRERMAASGRDGRAVGLVFLDVDHFKRINDSQGHVVGDLVLRILARRLEAALDPGQLLVRWGGEELVAVAPGLDGPDLEIFADRLRAVVGEMPLAIEGRPPLDVTVSAGCTAGPLRDLDGLVRIADDALYEAKRTGRDRVVHRPHRG